MLKELLLGKQRKYYEDNKAKIDATNSIEKHLSLLHDELKLKESKYIALYKKWEDKKKSLEEIQYNFIQYILNNEDVDNNEIISFKQNYNECVDLIRTLEKDYTLLLDRSEELRLTISRNNLKLFENKHLNPYDEVLNLLKNNDESLQLLNEQSTVLTAIKNMFESNDKSILFSMDFDTYFDKQILLKGSFISNLILPLSVRRANISMYFYRLTPQLVYQFFDGILSVNDIHFNFVVTGGKKYIYKMFIKNKLSNSNVNDYICISAGSLENQPICTEEHLSVSFSQYPY